MPDSPVSQVPFCTFSQSGSAQSIRLFSSSSIPLKQSSTGGCTQSGSAASISPSSHYLCHHHRFQQPAGYSARTALLRQRKLAFLLHRCLTARFHKYHSAHLHRQGLHSQSALFSSSSIPLKQSSTGGCTQSGSAASISPSQSLSIPSSQISATGWLFGTHCPAPATQAQRSFCADA